MLSMMFLTSTTSLLQLLEDFLSKQPGNAASSRDVGRCLSSEHLPHSVGGNETALTYLKHQFFSLSSFFSEHKHLFATTSEGQVKPEYLVSLVKRPTQ